MSDFYDYDEDERIDYKILKEALKQPKNSEELNIEGWANYLKRTQNQVSEFPKEILKYPNLKALRISTAGFTSIPPEIEQLKDLREINLDYNYRLAGLPDELFTIEKLEKVSFKYSVLPREYNQVQLNFLLKGFIKSSTPRHLRLIALNLFLGKKKKAQELASKTDLLRLLDSNMTVVRTSALLCLNEMLAKEMETNPLTKKSCIAFLGSFNFQKHVKEKMKRFNISFSSKMLPETTHVIVGEKPKNKYEQALEKNIPIGTEKMLNTFLSSLEEPWLLEPGSSGAPSNCNLAEILKSTDDENVRLALELMKEGGVPGEVMLELFLLCQDLKMNQALRKDARKLFFQYAPEHMREALSGLTNSLLLDRMGETKRMERIERLEQQCPEINGLKLAQLLLERSRFGVKYIFTHGSPDDAAQALKLFITGDTLVLTEKELKEIPAVLSVFSHIKKVDISGNHIVKFPLVLAELPRLEVLDLTYNRLGRLPVEIGSMKNLKELYLGENRFKKFPIALAELTAIETLDISHRSLMQYYMTRIPGQVKSLENLRTFDLGGNYLMPFPMVLCDMNSLEELNLLNCRLDAVPKELAQLTNLKKLNLRTFWWKNNKKPVAAITELKRRMPHCTISA
ncbi:MAG: hypothetical protein GY754_09875 [bacterium]|nr:hypothetical protein [bacterium]